MKTAVLCGIALICSSAAFAQTSPASVASTPKTITLTGCVGGGANAQPITLANAMVIPSTDQAGATVASPSPVPDAVSPTPTQPPSVGGAVGTAGTSGTGAAGTAGTSGTSRATGSAGIAGTTPTAGATGSAATGAATGSSSPTSGAVGTSGTISGTAPAGSSASSITGYRLSGTDMAPWVGRRVQILGTVVPAASGTSATGAASGVSTSGATAMPEFRVLSVQPVTGDCPGR